MATVLFVTYHFAPENASGTQRSLHFARALEDAGHRVVVVAPPAPDTDRVDPGLFDVFPWTDRIVRVAPTRTVGSWYMRWKAARGRTDVGVSDGSTSLLGSEHPARHPLARLRHHIRVLEALPDLQRAWLTPATRAGVTIGRRLQPDAVFSSGPPWTGVMAGHRIARTLGVPFIADFRDPWADGTGATWRYEADWAHRRGCRWEATVLAEATVVLFNSPRVADVARARHGLGDRARTILNGSAVERRSAPRAFPAEPPIRFTHYGSLYVGRTLRPLVVELARMLSDGGLSPSELEVDLVGAGAVPDAEHIGLTNAGIPTRLIPQLPFGEATAAMQGPSVLVASQPESCVRQVPTKLFDYLCTGNPVLVLTPEDSATWDLARRFSRCVRLDLQPSPHNTQAVAALVARWRGGQLRQERTSDDTAEWSKHSTGAEFVQLIETVIGSDGG